MSEWKPIDTVPKDGTWILVCGVDAWPPMPVKWHGDTIIRNGPDDYWVGFDFDPFDMSDIDYWMPLPPQPIVND